MLKVTHGDKEVRYYSLSEASSMVVSNQWDVPVDGINSETLRRAYRDKNGQVGKRIGRDVFFTEEDMTALGYKIKADDTRFFDIGNVITIPIKD